MNLDAYHKVLNETIWIYTTNTLTMNAGKKKLTMGFVMCALYCIISITLNSNLKYIIARTIGCVSYLLCRYI